jgi:hypothetical protein
MKSKIKQNMELDSNNLNDDKLPPPIPEEAIPKPIEVVKAKKEEAPETSGMSDDFQTFLKQWKPPSDVKVGDTVSFILVDKVDWSILWETSLYSEIENLLSQKFELTDKTEVIQVIKGELYHEDPFILRKAKKNLQDKLSKTLINLKKVTELELDVLADLVKSSDNFFKDKP